MAYMLFYGLIALYSCIIILKELSPISYYTKSYSDVMDLKFSNYTNLAISAATGAGKILKDSFGKSHTIKTKEGRHNLVTESDTACEALILSHIKMEYPNHNFLAEESGVSIKSESEFLWVIDPLDGTVNFAHHIPMFAVSIACVKKGQVISGVILHPLLNELFVAEKGNGAYLNGVKITVTETKELDKAILSTGFPYNAFEDPHKCIELFTHFIKEGLPIRRIGSAALDLAYLASGRYDAFWEVSLQAWDFAAGMLLIQEAGGTCSSFDGNALSLKESPILASNTHLHESMIHHIKSI